MMTVFNDNLIILIVALLVGLVVGFWLFRGRKGDHRRVEAPPPAARVEPAPPPRVQEAPPAPPPHRHDTPEGNSIFDEGAAATGDVTGELLGVEVHGELPGAEGPPDNLQLLKGVGPKLADKLNENGIRRYDQLARLSANEVDILDQRMGPFRGRLARDRIVEQASYLARGDRDGFEARFGKLGSGG